MVTLAYGIVLPIQGLFLYHSNLVQISWNTVLSEKLKPARPRSGHLSLAEPFKAQDPCYVSSRRVSDG